jgi:hypothetical protein
MPQIRAWDCGEKRVSLDMRGIVPARLSANSRNATKGGFERTNGGCIRRNRMHAGIGLTPGFPRIRRCRARGCAAVPRQYRVLATIHWRCRRRSALYEAMRAVIRTGAAVRSRQATRGELLLETLALHQPLGVLARSKKRFRPADRLFWLFLRWLWPRWREALVLIQPATVDRWHREGARRCWRRRSRRRKTLTASAPAFFRSRRQYLRDRRQCEINLLARTWPYAVLNLNSLCNRVVTSSQSRHFVQSARCLRRDSHGDRNIGEPQRRSSDVSNVIEHGN